MEPTLRDLFPQKLSGTVHGIKDENENLIAMATYRVSDLLREEICRRYNDYHTVRDAFASLVREVDINGVDGDGFGDILRASQKTLDATV